MVALVAIGVAVRRCVVLWLSVCCCCFQCCFCCSCSCSCSRRSCCCCCCCRYGCWLISTVLLLLVLLLYDFVAYPLHPHNASVHLHKASPRATISSRHFSIDSPYFVNRSAHTPKHISINFVLGSTLALPQGFEKFHRDAMIYPGLCRTTIYRRRWRGCQCGRGSYWVLEILPRRFFPKSDPICGSASSVQ